MDSKGNVRSGNKPDVKAPSSGKAEKPNPGPTTNADKKEIPKEQPAPATATSATKKAAGDAAVANNHSSLKPSPAAETQEAPSQCPDSDHKGNSSEEAAGSTFDNMKPLIILGGVAVAALAVIVGVAFLARKK
ncbi:CEND protein, partial [Indicator maculatus]|nr:CEND protein [Indicator maculatus]